MVMGVSAFAAIALVQTIAGDITPGMLIYDAMFAGFIWALAKRERRTEC
jgi:hypothetical protein